VAADWWQSLLRKFETIGSCDVSRRALSLGSRDADTGWCAMTYAATTQKMIIMFRGAPQTFYVPGAHVRRDALGLTDFAFIEGDLVYASGAYFMVKAVTPRRIGSQLFLYECDLDELRR